MSGYEIGDKVVVQVENSDNNDPKYDVSYSPYGHWISDDDILGKLEDFQTAEKKIQMTIDEKKEFDLLKERYITPYAAMANMRACSEPQLFKKVNTHESDEKRAQNQFEFFKAFEHPGLIEVVKPEHELKAGDLVRVRYFGENAIILSTAPSVDGVQDKDVVKIAYTDGSSEWIAKDRLKFIKSNAISWE